MQHLNQSLNEQERARPDIDDISVQAPVLGTKNPIIDNFIAASEQACSLFEQELNSLNLQISEIDQKKISDIKAIRDRADAEIEALHTSYSTHSQNLREQQQNVAENLNRVAQNRAALLGESWTPVVIATNKLVKKMRINTAMLSEVVEQILTQNPNCSKTDILRTLEKDGRFDHGVNLPATLARLLKQMNDTKKIELVNGAYVLEKTKQKGKHKGSSKLAPSQYDSALIQERVSNMLGNEALTVNQVRERLNEQGYDMGTDSRRVRGILLGLSKNKVHRSTNNEGKEIYSLG